MTNSQVEHVRRSTQADVPQKFVDLGDGTYAAAVSDTGAGWTSAYLHVSSADASAGADATAAPTTGQKIVVDDIILSTVPALTVTFEEETTGTDVLVAHMPESGVIQLTPRGKLKLATANKKLRIKTSGAGTVSATIFYHSEA